ncbi:MAG: HAD-IA family hydrolase [Candidatus Omnitrophota bacterium]
MKSKVIQLSHHKDEESSLERPWVFMDAGDTFIYAFPTLYEAIWDCFHHAEIDIDIEDIEAAARRYLTSHSRADLTSQKKFEKYFRNLYQGVLEDLGFPGEEMAIYVDDLWHEWEEGWRLRLFDDAIPALIMLMEAGFHLGIVTNWDRTFDPLLERMGLTDLFDVIVVSCREGVAKPDPRIFQLALERAGTTGDQSWFIGDQLDIDIQPAKKLGMKTVLVDYYGNTEDVEGADFVVPSLSTAALTMALEEDFMRHGGDGSE